MSIRRSVRTLAGAVLVALLTVALLVAPPASAEPTPHTEPNRTEVQPRFSNATMNAYLGQASGGGGTFRATVTARVSVSRGAAGSVRAAVRAQGYRVVRTIRPVRVSSGYRSFTYRNIRYNLSARTGYTRIEHDAHHIFPNQHRDFFARRGIRIDHPAYLRWWWRPSHQKKAYGYNQSWTRWIDENRGATRAQVMRRGQQMDRTYSKYYERPGPRGCEVHDCRRAA